jgi:hypothetical protein
MQIPDEVVAVFHNFRTVELTTIAKDGTPITWPVTAFYDEDNQEFIAATSIGLPQKAYNIRRNKHVALLFSEPRASGLHSPPAALVQGDAMVSENITVFEGIESVWSKIYRFQPQAKVTSSLPLTRYLMDWYYMRLSIRIAPVRIKWWADGDFSQHPQEIQHVG